MLLFAESSIWQMFGGDRPEFSLTTAQLAARAGLVYLIGLAIVRLGKSRLISRATPLDVILGFILGSRLSRGITGHASLSDTLLTSAFLVAIHWLTTALSCRSEVFDRWIKGNSSVLIKDGQVLQENLRHSHLSDEDLREALRLNGVLKLEEVESATKERNGEISVIKQAQS
jgi:uncharacterized membrane protein YcaP (DUF421 family)